MYGGYGYGCELIKEVTLMMGLDYEGPVNAFGVQMKEKACTILMTRATY